MRDEKYARQTLNAICSAYCDHVDDAVYSKERPNPLAGQEAGRLEHDRQAGVPHPGAAACFGRIGPPGARSADLPSDAHRVAAGPPRPPGPCQMPGLCPCIRNGTAARIRDGSRCRPQIWRWASGGAASPGKPSSTRIERSQFMTTQITSACSQCKGSVGRPSCGIALARHVGRAVRRCQEYP